MKTLIRLLSLSCALVASSVLHGQQPPTINDLVDLEREYVRARGGRVLVDETRTAVVRGRIVQGEQVITFQAYRRRPNQFRIDYALLGRELREGTDGTTAWRWLPMDSGPTVQRLEGEDALRLRREAEFDNPLINHSEQGANLTFLGSDVTAGGRAAYAVRIARRGFSRGEILLLDAETLLEAELREDPAGTGVPGMVTRYSDWKPIQGRPVPHVVETWLGERLVSRTEIERVTWNVGVLSDLFRVPEVETPAVSPAAATSPSTR